MSLADAKQDIERIRRAREEPAESSEESEVEIFTCPIEGCNRTVVGEPANLRHHVQHSGEQSHRFRTLNEDLEIVVHWDRMDWGPGVPEEVMES